MFSLILENENGEQIAFNRLYSPYQLTDITGLAAPEATINTNASALIDGATYNSAKTNMRVINLAFAIEYEAAKYRNEIYRILRIKKPVKVRYRNDYRDVFIDGYLQTLDIPPMTIKQICTVAILCPAPYFKAAQEMVNELEQTISTFHFPFSSTEEPQIVFGYIDTESSVSIENAGNVETGMTISLYARGAVNNPKIYNYTTGEYIELNYSLEAGDLVTITTGQGNKTAKLLRNAVESNLFNYIGEGTTWLQLLPGINELVYTAGSGATSLSVTISHYDLYEGV